MADVETILKDGQMISAVMHTSREAVAVNRWWRYGEVVSIWHWLLLPLVLALGAGTRTIFFIRAEFPQEHALAVILGAIATLVTGFAAFLWHALTLRSAGEGAIRLGLEVASAYDDERDIFKALSGGLSPETVIPHRETFQSILRDRRTVRAWDDFGYRPLESFDIRTNGTMLMNSVVHEHFKNTRLMTELSLYFTAHGMGYVTVRLV